MIRIGLGMLARAVIPAAMLMVFGASAGIAAALSPGALLERAFTAVDRGVVHQVGEGNQLRLERQIRQQDLQAGRSGIRRYGHSSRRYDRGHRRYGRRHYRSRGLHFGIFPYLPYQYGYGYSRPRYSGGSCSYWSRRCIANWGYGNSNYYGCMRYHGC